MIKAVLIDIDNTLLDFLKSAKEAIKVIFESFGLEYTDNVFLTFDRINEGLWKQIEKKEITKQDMYKLRWKLILEELSVDFDPDTMETAFRSTLSGIALPVDNAFELLDYLHGKYPLYAATNSSYEHQHKRLTKAGMLKYFDGLFVSERMGALKPAKEFFDVAFEEMGNIPPEDAILIGDSLTADILGGVNYGIKTVWYNPTNLPTPDHPRPDFTVSDLREIKDIL